jgi:hypothetical protein
MKPSTPLLLLLAACATAPARLPPPESLPVLGPLEAAVLYHDRSGTPLPADRLAHWYGEVCAERDPEARRAAVAEVRPRLLAEARRAAATPLWRVPLREALGLYDLARGGFATSLKAGAVVRFDSFRYCRQELEYLVLLENGASYAFLPLPEAHAKRLLRTNPGKQVVHELVVEITGAQPGPPAPTLRARIRRLVTRDATSNREIADFRAD